MTKKWVGRGATDSFDPRQGGELVEENIYDVLGDLKFHTDGNGNTTKYKYNLLGQLKEVEYPMDSTMEMDGISPYKVNYEYDAMRNLKKESDNYDKEILYEYDDAGRLQSETAQKNDETESITVGTRYDSNGNIRFKIDGEGNEIEYKYDELNRLKEMKRVVIKGSKTIEHIEGYTYDKNDNLLTTTDSVIRGGNTAESTAENVYDEINRLIEKKDAYGVSIEKIIYDESNRQIYSYDALDKRTDYEYDKNDRLIKTMYPEVNLERSIESSVYDFAGNIMIKEDGKNNQITYVYDEFDRLDYVIDAIGQKTNYEYDLNGNMIKQEMFDASENLVLSTTYQYNASDLMAKKIDHNGDENDRRTFEEYKYNAKGELRKKTGRSSQQSISNGTEVLYEYDIHGRLTEEIASKSQHSTVIISYEYDDNGNQIKMIDDTGETTRTYDELNRVISKNVGNISGEALYKYDILVFDGNDYLTAEVSVDNKGNETTKVYDKAGRLKYVVDDELASGSSISSADSSKLTEYDYYDNGARESIRHPQFTEGSNTYRYRQIYNYRNDGLLNILITHKMEITANGETVDSQLERFQYYYDKAGNQTSKFEIVDGVVKGTTDFEYDDLNRLEKVTEPEGRETVYTFDAAGNRKTETITESGTTVNKIYHYNDKNWLEEVEVLGAETIEYDYDEDGNQTEVRKVENGVTEVIAEYQYDPLNRLIEAVTDTATVTYAYNGEGRRVEKSTGQETTYYLYEYDKVVLEVDGNGNQVARNLYGINLLMRDVDGDSYYYVYNGHADVTALINADTGDVEATYYYDPFGNILESTGDVNNNIKYAGYQYDEETELYYLNARMYDPKVARFLQEDTYRGDPNDPLSLNLYAYTANNPIRYYDPTGHSYELRTYICDIKDLELQYQRQQFLKQLREYEQQKSVSYKKYNPVTRSIQSFRQIGSGFIEGNRKRSKKWLDSPYHFINAFAWGIPENMEEGFKQRAEKRKDSVYHFFNHMTWGSVDTVKGAFAPDERYSAEHWLDTLGFVGMVYGGWKMKENFSSHGGNSFTGDSRNRVFRQSDNLEFNMNFGGDGVVTLTDARVFQIPSIGEVWGNFSGMETIVGTVCFVSAVDGVSSSGGNFPNNKGTGKDRTFKELLDDIDSNPNDWQKTGESIVESTKKGNKGGNSVEIEYTNVKTGEKIYEHILKDINDNLIEQPHFRPYPKQIK
ncbi:RHS repeat-associated core domain-containing protein [Herbivorax sp. ANBcel31]|uniref:RHS repeat domain-containing protein n=1 Tax=Herbivorax sp. ANBcel31 TaxID=3069754 RepID=UPI0027B38887|nr:RHS repeat-associated core domain-containing protein [Herbivorax sp. ANBcel31]MDQ2085524.1 RHS repeat-associated core domain-containing protein [Herbivorax sp. ANBcel31]